ncbi:hypothetical protein [Larkinella soli]|uniref:hypothetical protein n=1 Tax=Larkinella soli TaxID=1770527 RepID=UPI000FFBD815|nr:hypothetical protein [Larkinella soli]
MHDFLRLWDGIQMHYLSQPWHGQQHVGVWMEDALVLVNLANPAERRVYEPTSPWHLMLPVGTHDRTGTILYECDWVEWTGRMWEISYSPQRCGFVLATVGALRPMTIPLNFSISRKLLHLGNRFEHPHLLGNTDYRQAA